MIPSTHPPASPEPPEHASPIVTHGPISGEVTDTSVVLWARGNRAGRLIFTLTDAAGQQAVASVEVGQVNDFTGKVAVTDLRPAQPYRYQVALSTAGEQSASLSGQFWTAPAVDTPADFSFLFGSCIGGQGHCRDAATGWPIFKLMLARQPAFFLLLGDSIYADTACPAPPNVPGAEGPYTDLAGLRTRYRYHLEDPHYAAFLARTPVYVTWDDHEIVNDFGGPALQLSDPQRLADGIQAYFEYWPLMGVKDEPRRIYRHFAYGAQADFFILDSRTYRDSPVKPALEPGAPFRSMLGPAQFAWLQQGLATSRATWKFVATSVPLAYPTGWPRPQLDGYDGWANSGLSGYEAEFMALLISAQRHQLKNLIFLSGDTHWPFALSYDPDRDGRPDFYEFGSSPISALPLLPVNPPDQSFNPTVLYADAGAQGNLFNFGQIVIEPDGRLTFGVVDGSGQERFALTLQPE